MQLCEVNKCVDRVPPSKAAHAFAFDFNHTGQLDCITLYRPGTGIIGIIRNENGNFVPIYRQDYRSSGIDGYDLRSRDDRAFAFDYNPYGSAPLSRSLPSWTGHYLDFAR
ncbi:hypothetical protein PILCRDRAFT_480508 [Piloderma croceum F 1598]|uniref:Uncharacterized protein n=1 Tax=Piloderma croceum (strain F 1598) TaxID=765440 RepID=A0A0C3B6U4_PILCF|nr:hypothetical protein PILCRDRAFT_480508 [Piloderma croceum F 1598]